jgi:glycine cleavage system aminomethyltransferase T
MDMSFMGKFLVQGRDAGAFLNYLSANDVDGRRWGRPHHLHPVAERRRPAGSRPHGDQVRRGEVHGGGSDTAHRHVETWMKRHIGEDQHVFVTDVTPAYGQLNIQGPKSRELLQSLTSTDLSNEAFPFRAVREIDIGLARVICVRITYVGELGYELNIPAEQALHVYDRIVEAGRAFGLRHAGLKALASLRLEKAYRDYGHDIDNTDDPYEVGLGFAVDLDKPGDFIGKAACFARKAAAPYAAAPGADPAEGPRAADAPCRGGAARRRAGGRRARRVLRPHAGRSGRPGHGHGDPVDAALPGGRRLGGGHRRPTLPGRSLVAAAVRPRHGARAGLINGVGPQKRVLTC